MRGPSCSLLTASAALRAGDGESGDRGGGGGGGDAPARGESTVLGACVGLTSGCVCAGAAADDADDGASVAMSHALQDPSVSMSDSVP